MVADLPNVNLKELSTDLWQITNAVSEGYCPDDLSKRNPGNLNHSWGLTTANRLLRLYTWQRLSHQRTCRFLQRTCTLYIVKVYAPMWFSIKGKPLCKDGARHLLRSIQLSRYLSVEHKRIVDPVI